MDTVTSGSPGSNLLLSCLYVGLVTHSHDEHLLTALLPSQSNTYLCGCQELASSNMPCGLGSRSVPRTICCIRWSGKVTVGHDSRINTKLLILCQGGRHSNSIPYVETYIRQSSCWRFWPFCSMHIQIILVYLYISPVVKSDHHESGMTFCVKLKPHLRLLLCVLNILQLWLPLSLLHL